MKIKDAIAKFGQAGLYLIVPAHPIGNDISCPWSVPWAIEAISETGVKLVALGPWALKFEKLVFNFEQLDEMIDERKIILFEQNTEKLVDSRSAI